MSKKISVYIPEMPDARFQGLIQELNRSILVEMMFILTREGSED